MTRSPVSSRTPTTSLPGTNGSVAPPTYWSWRWCVSAKLMPARATRISTSPSLASGRSVSTSWSTSGPPNSSILTALIGDDRCMSFVISDEEQQIRESVTGIAAGFGRDYIKDCVENEKPPTELWDALAEKGFVGVNIPEEYDGGGRGMTELAAVMEELALAACSLLLMVVPPAIAGSVLAPHGTPEQKERWLRGIASGELKIAFAITEPDAGTNTHNLQTVAERRNGKYVLRGQKTFISGVEDSDALFV